MVHELRQAEHPVEVVNTSGETLSGLDGLGYWNLDWETLKAGNAGG